jgi:hypothetical protein
MEQDVSTTPVLFTVNCAFAPIAIMHIRHEGMIVFFMIELFLWIKI